MKKLELTIYLVILMTLFIGARVASAEPFIRVYDYLQDADITVNKQDITTLQNTKLDNTSDTLTGTLIVDGTLNVDTGYFFEYVEIGTFGNPDTQLVVRIHGAVIADSLYINAVVSGTSAILNNLIVNVSGQFNGNVGAAAGVTFDGVDINVRDAAFEADSIAKNTSISTNETDIDNLETVTARLDGDTPNYVRYGEEGMDTGQADLLYLSITADTYNADWTKIGNRPTTDTAEYNLVMNHPVFIDTDSADIRYLSITADTYNAAWSKISNIPDIVYDTTQIESDISRIDGDTPNYLRTDTASTLPFPLSVDTIYVNFLLPADTLYIHGVLQIGTGSTKITHDNIEVGNITITQDTVTALYFIGDGSLLDNVEADTTGLALVSDVNDSFSRTIQKSDTIDGDSITNLTTDTAAWENITSIPDIVYDTTAIDEAISRLDMDTAYYRRVSDSITYDDISNPPDIPDTAPYAFVVDVNDSFATTLTVSSVIDGDSISNLTTDTAEWGLIANIPDTFLTDEDTAIVQAMSPPASEDTNYYQMFNSLALTADTSILGDTNNLGSDTNAFTLYGNSLNVDLGNFEFSIKVKADTGDYIGLFVPAAVSVGYDPAYQNGRITVKSGYTDFAANAIRLSIWRVKD